ncbi:MAG: signal peptidase I [Chloroflexi bacterium]|nr:signal peptidase I [Chloroflexota bacterium]
MKTGHRSKKLDWALVALLLMGVSYLGLVLLMGTPSPFLLVRGASMQPTYHAGDLLLSRNVPISEVKPGDVIAFSVPKEASKGLKLPPAIAHRVVAIEGDKGQLSFATKGDNSDADPFRVPASSVHGVVVKNLGGVGRIILLLTSRTVLVFLVLPGVAFVSIVGASLWLSPGSKGEKAPTVAAGAALQPVPMEQAIGTLAAAVAEYGMHLQSHTAIIKHMAGTSEGLEQAVYKQADSTGELRQAMQQQNQVLADLTVVVERLKELATGPAGHQNWASLADMAAEGGNGRHTNGQHIKGQHTKGQRTNGQHTNGQHTNGQHTNGHEEPEGGLS